jgi:pimeloyl-ACP methyl ester carboxylesterase
VLCATLLLGAASGRAVAVAPDYTRAPVLFVHGHGESAGYWDDLMRYLVAQGYPRDYLYAVTIHPNTMANDRAASAVLAPAVEKLLARAHESAASQRVAAPGKVDLIGHSMGAVSSRWYTSRLHPERVRRWVSLAGANHGTDVLCEFSDDGGRDLCPAFADSLKRNPVQTGLNGTRSAPRDETPYGLGTDRREVARVASDPTRRIAYYTIRIEPDDWIKPERSAVVDGAGGLALRIPHDIPVRETSPGNYLFHGKDSHSRPVDHTTLLFHSGLHRLVWLILSATDESPAR